MKADFKHEEDALYCIDEIGGEVIDPRDAGFALGSGECICGECQLIYYIAQDGEIYTVSVCEFCGGVH